VLDALELRWEDLFSDCEPNVVNVVRPFPNDENDVCLIEHDVAAMLAAEPPEVEWLVPELLVRGHSTMLAGREGEGKSMMALALTSTHPELRFVYVDAENGPTVIAQRLHALNVAPGNLRYLEAARFHLGRQLEGLTARLDGEDVLVLDSFRSLWPGGDENSSDQVDPVLQALGRLTRERDLAVLLLHHAGKGNFSYRGSTALGAGVGLGFTLRRHDDDPQQRTRREVRCWKCRPAEEPHPYWLSIGSKVERTEPYDPGADELREEILDAVKPGETVSGAEAAQRVGRNRRDNAVLGALKALVGEGLFERPSSYRWRRVDDPETSSSSFVVGETTKTTFRDEAPADPPSPSSSSSFHTLSPAVKEAPRDDDDALAAALAEAFDGEWDEAPPPEPGRRISDADSHAHVRRRMRRAFARDPRAVLFLHAYATARASGANGAVDPHLACRQRNGYMCPKCAAELLGVSPQRLAGMRRKGEVETVGMTPSEYRAARDKAGWTEGAWGPGVFYLRASLRRVTA
jgi:hypothetical protein